MDRLRYQVIVVLLLANADGELTVEQLLSQYKTALANRYGRDHMSRGARQIPNSLTYEPPANSTGVINGLHKAGVISANEEWNRFAARNSMIKLNRNI